MLTQEELDEIQAELPRYEKKQAVSIDAMKIVQKHRGWVSDENIRDIAQLLDMTSDELDSIATFYNLIFRRPVGRHVVMMCDSITCWILGYPKLRERMKSILGVEMGETSADGRFTFLPIVCLGTCDHAPAMMIDNDTYRDLAPDKLEEILKRYE